MRHMRKAKLVVGGCCLSYAALGYPRPTVEITKQNERASFFYNNV